MLAYYSFLYIKEKHHIFNFRLFFSIFQDLRVPRLTTPVCQVRFPLSLDEYKLVDMKWEVPIVKRVEKLEKMNAKNANY